MSCWTAVIRHLRSKDVAGRKRCKEQDTPPLFLMRRNVAPSRPALRALDKNAYYKTFTARSLFAAFETKAGPGQRVSKDIARDLCTAHGEECLANSCALAHLNNAGAGALIWARLWLFKVVSRDHGRVTLSQAGFCAMVTRVMLIDAP